MHSEQRYCQEWVVQILISSMRGVRTELPMLVSLGENDELLISIELQKNELVLIIRSE